MSTTITLDKRHFTTAARKARELGKTPQCYIQSLIDAATLTLDEVLLPVRTGFATTGITEEQLDQVVTQARKAIHAQSGRRSGK